MPSQGFSFARRALVALAALAAALPGAALAQYIGAAPPPPLAPIPGFPENPSTALARNVRLLALSPRNFDALIGAGRAAVALGDPQAAVGFFGRAEEVFPRSPAPKAGTAAALVAMEQPVEALGYFDEAVRLGASQASIGTDRGLAFDLTGEPLRAQADYRAALFGPEGPEARRRLALSLAIGRDRAGALAALAPLLGRRDPATERVRAFVLALTGDVAGARAVVEVAMPGASGNMEPFLQKLSRISPDQQAAAVHFGKFPEASTIRLATVAPPTAAQPAPDASKVSVTPRAPSRRELRKQRTPVYASRTVTATPLVAPPASAPVAAPTLAPPPVTATIATAPRPAATIAAPTLAPEPTSQPTVLPSQRVAAEPPVIPPDAAPGFSTRTASASPLDRLSEIDRLLGSAEKPAARLATIVPPKADNAPEPPPPSVPKVESAKPPPPSVPKVEKPAPKPAAKPAAKPAPKPLPRHWVQLAGGSKTERMPIEYQRIKAKKPVLFAKRTAHVAELKGWARLLVGPFKSEDEAQIYVNQLAKADIAAFSWTSPASQAIEKLPAK